MPLMGPKQGVYWNILQTYTAAEVAFDRHARLLHGRSDILRKKPNESDLTIHYSGWRDVFYKSGEVFENLRSETLHGCIIDEARQQKKELMTRIIMPMLARFDGWLDIMTTPNGFDWVYDLHEEAKLNPNEWGVFHCPCTEAPWWTPKMILEAKSHMSEPEFAQEIMAEFRDMTSGRAYTNYSVANDRADSPFKPGHEYSEHLPVYCFMDFNLAPMAWVMGQNKGVDTHFTDEVWLKYISDPFEPARNLITKLKALPFNVNHHGLVIIGDASGKATQRTSMQSDYDIVCQMLDQAGIRWFNRTPAANPGIKDRVNVFNARLCDANGQRHVTLNPNKCPYFKKDLQRTNWKKTDTPTLDSGPQGELGHISDAAGYGIYLLSPLHKAPSVGTLRVLTR